MERRDRRERRGPLGFNLPEFCGLSFDRRVVLAFVLSTVLAVPARAAELKPATVAAFERYQRAAEAAIDADIGTPDRFLRVVRGDQSARQAIDAQLRRGEVAVTRLQVTEQGKRIEVPDGLIHHWVGTVFIPQTHIADAVALMQDYDRHQQVFRPAIAASRTLERNGDRFRLYLRFFMKKVISVTVNTESSAEFTRPGADRVVASIRSTRIQEVESPGTPQEKERPIGRDGGFLWRLNTYWRYLERDGGTYVECESLTLTRSIPLGLGWVVGPFVTSLPRDLLTSTLETARKTLVVK